MALNPSGAISLGGTTSGQSIELENGGPGTTVISLNDSAVRSLAGVASGAITMPTDFWGKSNAFIFTLASGTDINLRSAAISAGWPGSGAVQATINSGSIIQSSSTGSYALTIDGSWPGGVVLTNNGTIEGRGGNGGPGSTGIGSGPPTPPGSPGGNGGTAILASVACTINNSGGIIAGGGGGGGGGGGNYRLGGNGGSQGGGGGGGGIGVSSAGAGAPGISPRNAAPGSPGTAGTLTSAGSGGGGGYGTGGGAVGGSGGAGGGYGSTGSPGGDGYGPYSNYPGPGGSGGSGGNAVSGNSNITWPALGTIYGARV